MGITARSWQGWQIPIITDNAHGVARIEDIPGDKIRARLEQGEVAVIAGFQGVEPERNRISTLGRGGSDTSAVAIAAAVKADLCDIYTDVDGVYTTDPRIVPQGPAAGQDLLRGDAGDGLAGLQGAADALGRARHGTQDARARAVELRRARGHAAGAAGDLGQDRHHHLRRGRDRGTADRQRHRLRQGRGQDHPLQGRRQAGRRRQHLRPAGRRQHQRRHDRAEHVLRRQAHRHDVHRAGVASSTRALEVLEGAKKDIGYFDVKAPPTSPRSR